MTFFRSEEHLRNWTQFKLGMEEGIFSLPDLLKLFSGQMFWRRLAPDYFTRMREYAVEWITTMQEIGKAGPFWSLKKA
ncbi:MAG: hypothetical protein WBK44_10005 [Smithellaceae bacterium]|jgi:hypothetical protein|nr:hypothetical protein [Syntrophaceae bacterium]MDD5487220.1 hypothetical protein [Dehalococcoidales bacterium]MDX9816422.1 hypothetical protein [Smithellaceae bacterium]NMD04841.1 hypothetical protein [Deltaproteobacteria bacterium]MBP8607830.1 hypothetical protein [Syntrophaceae bacterium]